MKLYVVEINQGSSEDEPRDNLFQETHLEHGPSNLYQSQEMHAYHYP